MQYKIYTNSERILEPEKLHDFYNIFNWNKDGTRTIDVCEQILANSCYYISVLTQENQLIGFGRILSDGYVCMILDIMTHPDYRRQGIAKQVMGGVMEYLDKNRICAMLIDGSGFKDFYEQSGFEAGDGTYSERVMYWRKS